jgi:hypothetical protein
MSTNNKISNHISASNCRLNFKTCGQILSLNANFLEKSAFLHTVTDQVRDLQVYQKTNTIIAFYIIALRHLESR